MPALLGLYPLFLGITMYTFISGNLVFYVVSIPLLLAGLMFLAYGGRRLRGTGCAIGLE
ncbi:MAG: hypothetical protein AB7E27_03060 [Candidatus Methanomethylophilaceae archaeon]